VQLVRSFSKTDPRRFGRGPVRVHSAPAEPKFSLSSDLQLFAGTFVAGFLFVSILIG